MSIKVTLGEVKPQVKEKPFPKLMISSNGTPTDDVVLFLNEKTGMKISGSGTGANFSILNWDKDCFTDFSKSITLQND